MFENSIIIDSINQIIRSSTVLIPHHLPTSGTQPMKTQGYAATILLAKAMIKHDELQLESTLTVTSHVTTRD